jgi:hypothetical protein
MLHAGCIDFFGIALLLNLCVFCKKVKKVGGAGRNLFVFVGAV